MRKYNYWRRLKKACEYRGIDVNAISKLVDVVRKRASGDRHVDNTFHPIISQLEPPTCCMSHCDYHTAYGFCGCGKNLVPSQCKKHRDFLDRQYDRMQKVYLEGREFVKNAPKPLKFECPYEKHGKYIGNKDKYALFCQGAEDEYKKLPIRSMKTGKLQLEWGIPTPETIDEYYFRELKREPGSWSSNGHENEEALTKIAERLELAQFEILYHNEFDGCENKMFITKKTKTNFWGPDKVGMALKKVKSDTATSK